MNVFRHDIVTEIKGDHIQQIQVHGVVGKGDFRDFVNTAVLQVELGYEEVVGERVTVYRWYGT
ncbi:hypothetical protein DPPLL_12610 [Desulfofustis limnaeus]|uniref:Uncharacterized protein n=1 Tax=Desulfofustis limnaeus TaxID=2740163 RepID=A0ABM7W7D0_9BACT|nr:hypothetical protein DPPLL_12610 [Desulfofustis limnaeus]